ncbi:MAG: type VI secretion system contractile sheath small subunit [Candidatus Sedimenticola sp. (ex Thyasira tokunagai)]
MAIKDDKNMPKSRVTLRYRTEINGVPEDIILPLRLLIAGDFSGHQLNGGGVNPTAGQIDGQSNERLDLDKRTLFDASLINDLEVYDADGIKLSSGDRYNAIMQRLNVKTGLGINEIKFTKLSDFLPNRVLENSGPEINNHFEIRRLLNGVKANLANSKQYRQAIEDVLVDPLNGEAAALSQQLSDFLKVYQTQTTLGFVDNGAN